VVAKTSLAAGSGLGLVPGSLLACLGLRLVVVLVAAYVGRSHDQDHQAAHLAIPASGRWASSRSIALGGSVQASRRMEQY